jgi:hypothetical protein
MSWPSCINRVSAAAMSSCNALSQRWAIKPIRTGGWTDKTSCNGLSDASCNGGRGAGSAALQATRDADTIGAVSDLGGVGEDIGAGAGELAASTGARAFRRL